MGTYECLPMGSFSLYYGQYEGLESVGRALKDLAERKVYGKIVVSVMGKSRL
jgi:hypothetical protein